MHTVGVYSILHVAGFVKDDESGKYVDDGPDETYSDEQYRCGECGEQLPKDAADEFVKLIEGNEDAED